MTKDRQVQLALDRLYKSDAPDSDGVQRRLNESAQRWKKAIWVGTYEDSPVGPIQIAVGPQGVVATEFSSDREAFAAEMEAEHGAPVIQSDERIAIVVQQLREYFSGSRHSFHLAVDLTGLTEFQRQVLRVTGQVPHGELLTYGEVARRIGRPGAARAVGQALGRNPVPIIVPCHRVVGADGALTGYSGGHGVETKAKLLQLEGAAF